MEESILTSIKKLLGVSKECTDFDTDIIMDINTVFMVLNQMGVGPKEGYRIEDNKSVWSDYIQDADNLDGVKSYIHLRVKLLFDPPLNSAIIEAINNSIRELEWRLTHQAEFGKKEV